MIRPSALLWSFTIFATCGILPLAATGQTATTKPVAKGNAAATAGPGDAQLSEYFRRETEKIEAACLTDVGSAEDWNSRRPELKRQLLEMLGLDPPPERTPLEPQITGRVEQDEFVVERLQFQSRPGLYVTGNLYLPKKIDKPLPTILYVCGHGNVKKGDVSYGSKAHYQHHGSWYARNGYACLVIDTLQLGEIEGIHHGTYRYGMWWWLNRGYTPAGVEAWNCVRALDYLQSRKEIDPERIGVTGRSGGGAYSWWIAAIDERIKAAVPTAGITDLRNHVVDGVVEGHCDCMYMVNTYRWDYAQVAAMIAPRPLLLANTDDDRIFPLDGVYRVFGKVRNVYTALGAKNKLGLNITYGGHYDTQELQVHAMRWFDKHLKGVEQPVPNYAAKWSEPEPLRVFAQNPADEKNTQIHESFVSAAATAAIPTDKADWEKLRDGWLAQLQAKSFRGWPEQPPALDLKPAFTAERDGVKLAAYDFTSQEGVRLRLMVLHRAGLEKADLNVLNVVDEAGYQELLAQLRTPFSEKLVGEKLPAADDAGWKSTREMFANFPWVMSYIAPRGVGPTAFDASDKKQVQIRRRFYLLGLTLDEMQVWDVRRAIAACRGVPTLEKTPLWLQSKGVLGGVALYASLFEPEIKRLDLYDLPQSHRNGPIFLNVSKILDMPQAVAIGAERSQVVLYQADSSGWEWPRQTAEKLGWGKKQLQLRSPPKK